MYQYNQYNQHQHLNGYHQQHLPAYAMPVIISITINAELIKHHSYDVICHHDYHQLQFSVSSTSAINHYRNHCCHHYSNITATCRHHCNHCRQQSYPAVNIKTSSKHAQHHYRYFRGRLFWVSSGCFRRSSKG